MRCKKCSQCKFFKHSTNFDNWGICTNEKRQCFARRGEKLITHPNGYCEEFLFARRKPRKTEKAFILPNKEKEKDKMKEIQY